jgi:hypothetical protein
VHLHGRLSASHSTQAVRIGSEQRSRPAVTGRWRGCIHGGGGRFCVVSVSSSIDVTGWVEEEQLAQASPDLMRSMVQTFVRR